jgi:hypothetical protein
VSTLLDFVRAVMPTLMAALDDRNRFVRNHAAEALAAYAAEAKGADLSPWPCKPCRAPAAGMIGLAQLPRERSRR